MQWTKFYLDLWDAKLNYNYSEEGKKKEKETLNKMKHFYLTVSQKLKQITHLAKSAMSN